jgi:hypothetical protein
MTVIQMPSNALRYRKMGINDHTGSNFASSEDFADKGVQVIDGKTGDRKSVYMARDLDPSDIVNVEGIPMTVAQAKAAGYSFDGEEPIPLESNANARLSDNEDQAPELDLREEGAGTDAEIVALDNIVTAAQMHTGLDEEATIELGSDIVERDRNHRAPGCRLRTVDERARYWADHLQRDGIAIAAVCHPDAARPLKNALAAVSSSKCIGCGSNSAAKRLMSGAVIRASPVLNCIPMARSSNHSIMVMSFLLPTTSEDHPRGSSCNVARIPHGISTFESQRADLQAEDGSITFLTSAVVETLECLGLFWTARPNFLPMRIVPR